MKLLKHCKIGLISALALVFGFSMAFTLAPSASAAETKAYTAAGICNSEAPGSGYYVQRSHALNGARVYQLYNGSYNCVVTIKTASVGTPTLTNACVKVTGSGWNCNKGEFKNYAGAVWLYGKGKCAKYFGYHGGVNYESPWGNCG